MPPSDMTVYVHATPRSRWPYEAVLQRMRDGMLAEYVRSAYGWSPDEALRRLHVDQLGVTVVSYHVMPYQSQFSE